MKINQHFPWLVGTLNALPFFIAKHIMPLGALDMIAFSEVSLGLLKALDGIASLSFGGVIALLYLAARNQDALTYSIRESRRRSTKFWATRAILARTKDALSSMS